MMSSKSNQAGLSLLEILISLFLSTLIIAALSEQYLSIKKWVNHIERWLTQESDLLTVATLLRKEIHHAGFTPCGAGENLIHPNSPHYQAIIVKNNGLTLHHMSTPIVEVKAQAVESAIINTPIPFQRDQTLLIADCFHTELVRVKSIHQPAIHFYQPLIYKYESPAFLGLWRTHSFYLRKSPLGKFGLFYQAHKKDLLAEGINKFEITKKNKVYQIDIQPEASPLTTIFSQRKNF